MPKPSLATSLAFVVLAGCGSGGPELAAVRGTVTLDGRPVPGAAVTFYPQAGSGPPSFDRTDADGRYELAFDRDRRGAVLGRHLVEITTPGLWPADLAALRASGLDAAGPMMILPAKYRRAGTLVAEVRPDENAIDFPLTTE